MRGFRPRLVRALLTAALAMTVWSRPAAAQPNLVPNPSFETFTQCPNTFAQLNFVPSWTSPTQGTPDYFNACAAPPVGVPANYFGTQSAYGGVAYVGFQGHTPSNSFREYFEAPLTAPLVANRTYRVSFYVSLADSSLLAIDRVGARLSVGSTGPQNYTTELPLTPQVENPPQSILYDFTNWTLVTGLYVAAGGEDHITIGNFYDNVNTTSQPSQTNGFRLAAYYYVDEVSVREAVFNHPVTTVTGLFPLIAANTICTVPDTTVGPLLWPGCTGSKRTSAYTLGAPGTLGWVKLQRAAQADAAMPLRVRVNVRTVSPPPGHLTLRLTLRQTDTSCVPSCTLPDAVVALTVPCDAAGACALDQLLPVSSSGPRSLELVTMAVLDPDGVPFLVHGVALSAGPRDKARAAVIPLVRAFPSVDAASAVAPLSPFTLDPRGAFGWAKYRTMVPPTPGAPDVALKVLVRTAHTDLTPPGDLPSSLTLSMPFRVTSNVCPSGVCTTVDMTFPVTVPCMRGVCAVRTTMNTVLAGTVVAGAAAGQTFEFGPGSAPPPAGLDPITVTDGSRAFLTAGVFVP